MHQRQPRHLESGAALASVLALLVTWGLAPGSARAQAQCATELKEQTSGPVANQGTVCATAVGNKCTFELAVCVNQPGNSCTTKDLKHKKIRASSLCTQGGKVNVKANGTNPVCGSFVGVTVKTKKHGTKAHLCKISAKAGSSKSTITLDCEPSSGTCPGATTTTTTTAATTTTIPCTCPTSGFHRLSFTTGIGSGNCGTLQLSNGSVLLNLACGGLYTGGGQNSVPLPYAVPDMGTSLTALSPGSGTTLTLGNLTSTDTGSNRTCTSVGCLFGPPLPIPNSGTTPTSICVINSVSANGSGTADCCSGASALSLPLNSELFLTGDLFSNAPGIQSCPTCNKTCNAGSNNTGPCNSDADCTGAGAGSCVSPSNAGCTAPMAPWACCTGSGTGSCAGITNTCHGGPNDGMTCTPADTPTYPSFPTSHDCPPPAALDIGGLPIGFALTTGTVSKTAVNNTASGQNNVFCGFCRDKNAAGTGCFEGDPNTPPQTSCPRNDKCTGSLSPFNCCTGAGTGSCDHSAKLCASNADCTDGNGTWPDCIQRDPGAFSRGTARTITETGSPAGNMTDGAGHASALVSIFCIPPTFNATVDAAGDLPGPGAVALSGTAQLK